MRHAFTHTHTHTAPLQGRTNSRVFSGPCTSARCRSAKVRRPPQTHTHPLRLDLRLCRALTEAAPKLTMTEQADVVISYVCAWLEKRGTFLFAYRTQIAHLHMPHTHTRISSTTDRAAAPISHADTLLQRLVWRVCTGARRPRARQRRSRHSFPQVRKWTWTASRSRLSSRTPSGAGYALCPSES